jgi:hypothetical protein
VWRGSGRGVAVGCRQPHAPETAGIRDLTPSLPRGNGTVTGGSAEVTSGRVPALFQTGHHVQDLRPEPHTPVPLATPLSPDQLHGVPLSSHLRGHITVAAITGNDAQVRQAVPNPEQSAWTSGDLLPGPRCTLSRSVTGHRPARRCHVCSPFARMSRNSPAHGDTTRHRNRRSRGRNGIDEH